MKVVMLVWVIATYLLPPNVPQNMLILCAKTNQNHAVLGSERNGASQLDSPGNLVPREKWNLTNFSCIVNPLTLFLQWAVTHAQECIFEACYFNKIFFWFKTPGTWVTSILSSLCFLSMQICAKMERNFIWDAAWILDSWYIQI